MFKRAVEKDTFVATFILFCFLAIDFAWMDCIIRIETYPHDMLVALITISVIFVVGFAEFVSTGRE